MTLAFPDLSRMPAIKASGLEQLNRQDFVDELAKHLTLSAAGVWGLNLGTVRVNLLGKVWAFEPTQLAGCHLLTRDEPATDGSGEDIPNLHFLLIVEDPLNNGLRAMRNQAAWLTFASHNIPHDAWHSSEVAIHAALSLLGMLRRYAISRRE